MKFKFILREQKKFFFVVVVISNPLTVKKLAHNSAFYNVSYK